MRASTRGPIRAGSTAPAGARLATALARTPEPPPTVCIVSWRRTHQPAEAPTKRRFFEYVDQAVAFRAQLEQAERTHGEGVCSVRIDVARVWVEIAGWERSQ